MLLRESSCLRGCIRSVVSTQEPKLLTQPKIAKSKRSSQKARLGNTYLKISKSSGKIAKFQARASILCHKIQMPMLPTGVDLEVKRVSQKRS